MSGLRYWTSREEQALVLLMDKGWKDPAIAAELGRSLEAVRLRRHKLRCWRRGRDIWLGSAEPLMALPWLAERLRERNNPRRQGNA